MEFFLYQKYNPVFYTEQHAGIEKEHLRRINQYIEYKPDEVLQPVCCKSLLFVSSLLPKLQFGKGNKQI
jgi:hypothetical protein